MSTQRSGRTGVKQSVTVKYPDFELDVKGYYNEGDKGDDWTPPTPSGFEIDSATFKGVDVLDLIAYYSDLDQLENDCIKQIEQ
jgi:hypothetical protein